MVLLCSSDSEALILVTRYGTLLGGKHVSGGKEFE